MKPVELKICNGMSCQDRWSQYIVRRIDNDKEFYKESKSVQVETCGCQWKCKEWNVIVLDGKEYTYQNPATVSKLVWEKVKKMKVKRK